VVCIVAVGLGAMWSAAQEPPSQQQMADDLRSNQEDLLDYTWTSRYTYRVDGVQKREDVYTVRYVLGGMQEKMQISSEVDKKKVRFPDGSKLKKKEREAAHAFVLDVKKQLDGYLNPLFAEKAVATASMALEGEDLILRSRSVVTPGDTVEIRYSRSALLPRSMTVATAVDASPVSLEVEFGKLEFGPSYPARSVTAAAWQGLHLEISTENSGHEPVGR
jgi:hypothetical protein